jgi:hypothetical protein
MADYDTPTNCTLLTVWSDDPRVRDHWVASHQILPFFATIYGWDPRWVMIAVYGVETVENFVWCLERAYTEDFSNTSISDPLHGVFGILVGVLWRMIFGPLRVETEYIAGARNTIVTLFDVGFMVAPSAIFYARTRDFDMLYVLLFPLAYLLVSRHLGRVTLREKLEMFALAYAYVCVTCFVVFVAPLSINSFYSAWISATCVGLVFGALAKSRSFDRLAN